MGEAERQLRLLFEEATRQQPSIIFFDEIDGLAPVRSSKQDQVHNSIVSTLLALMDGLDARGKVGWCVVCGGQQQAGPGAHQHHVRTTGPYGRLGRTRQGRMVCGGCGGWAVCSSKQDQVHNSIVSTLLAVMDGLDARGKVGWCVVCGGGVRCVTASRVR